MTGDLKKLVRRQWFTDMSHKSGYGLTKYLIDDGKKHPFAIICPGGGYGVVSSYVEGLPFAKALNDMGYHAFVLYYSVGSKARYPAPQNDLERAVKEVFANADEWNVDTDCWSLWGSSAGGHLAASFCLEHRPVDLPGCLVLIYPVITMEEHAHKGSRRKLLGRRPDGVLAERLSVEENVGEDYPPTYIWCGTADKCVEPVNSHMMDEALTKNGVRHVFEEFEGVGHGVGLGKDLPWFNNAVRFWRECRAK